MFEDNTWQWLVGKFSVIVIILFFAEFFLAVLLLCVQGKIALARASTSSSEGVLAQRWWE